MPQGTVLYRLDRPPDLLTRKQGRATVQVDDSTPGRTPGRQRARREEFNGGGQSARGRLVAALPASGAARAGPGLEEAVAPDRPVVGQRDDVRVPEGRQRGAATEPGGDLDAAPGRNAPQPDRFTRRQVDGLARGPDEEPVGEDSRRHDAGLFCKIVADGGDCAETRAFQLGGRSGPPRFAPEVCKNFG